MLRSNFQRSRTPPGACGPQAVSRLLNLKPRANATEHQLFRRTAVARMVPRAAGEDRPLIHDSIRACIDDQYNHQGSPHVRCRSNLTKKSSKLGRQAGTQEKCFGGPWAHHQTKNGSSAWTTRAQRPLSMPLSAASRTMALLKQQTGRLPVGTGFQSKLSGRLSMRAIGRGPASGFCGSNQRGCGKDRGHRQGPSAKFLRWAASLVLTQHSTRAWNAFCSSASRAHGVVGEPSTMSGHHCRMGLGVGEDVSPANA